MIIETEEGVSPAVAQTLRVIALAMGGGLTMVAGLVALFNTGARTPTPVEIRTINALTTVAMVFTLLAIAASELLWRKLLKSAPGALGARVQTAFIARLACREAAGLLGLTVAYIAAINGVLRLYPAYWVDLAPFVLFLGFLAAHFPSAEKLTAEAREILGSGL
jgi:hypothetical protein